MPPPPLSLPPSPTFTTLTPCHNSSMPETLSPKLQLHYTRRATSMAALATIFLAEKAAINTSLASAFEFRVTTPDQTLEEAEVGVRIHARQILEIKPLLDLESWKEAQKALRESSPSLKQDIYTIIQSKPGNQRPQLRKLYSKLFNSVTSLDYAAREKDAVVVQECYKNIVETLDQIFAMI